VRVLDYVGLIVPSSEVSPTELSLRGCISADNVPNPFGAGTCQARVLARFHLRCARLTLPFLLVCSR
jgi:hypothetical protein